MKKSLILIYVVFLLFSITSSFAQSNLPGEYNWCDDPNAWGDGRCEQTTQLNTSVCHQMMGWYLPRIANNEISLTTLHNNQCLTSITSIIIVDQQNDCTSLTVNLTSSVQNFNCNPIVNENNIKPDVSEDTAPKINETDIVEEVQPQAVTISSDNKTSTLSIDYNWCTDPNAWGDGRCDYPDREDLTVCHWELGWYLPRVETGEILFQDIVTPCLAIIIQETDNISVKSSDGCKFLVIVFDGSPATATADVQVSGASYDGTTQDLAGCFGLRIYGNDSDNTITGSSGNDQIYGYGGNDNIYGDSIAGGGRGNDLIDGGAGNDNLFGDAIAGDGSGNDTIIGGEGNDFIYGDTLSGNGSGDDSLSGEDDNDTIFGDSNTGHGSGNDKINSGDGTDSIYGDTLSGNGSGNDDINSGSDDDTIFGDSVSGNGTGNDTIDGGSGDDTIYGDTNSGNGSGDDNIDGGSDTDNINGPGNSQDNISNVETNNSTPDN